MFWARAHDTEGGRSVTLGTKQTAFGVIRCEPREHALNQWFDMSQESEHPRSMSSRSPELKFHQLQYLIAVAEHGSLRMAAQSREFRCGNQQRASRAGKCRGHAFAGTAGTRAGNTSGARATPAGTGDRRASAGRQDEINRMQATVETKLSISVTPWIAQSLLASTVVRFLAARPDVSLNLVETFGTDYTALREGSLDIAVGLAPEQTPRDLISRPPSFLRAGHVCRRGHPLQEARIPLSIAGSQSWILSHEIDQYKSPLQEFFNSAPEDPKRPEAHRLHYSSTLIALQMIENSDMLCLMPSPLLEAVRDRYRVEGVALEEPLPHNRDKLSDAAQHPRQWDDRSIYSRTDRDRQSGLPNRESSPSRRTA